MLNIYLFFKQKGNHMKYLLVLIILFTTASSFAQTTTYSKEEERMVAFANNGLSYAKKYDSLLNVKPVIDSCRRFLKKYPRSFAKPNVFSYMLEMIVLISKDLAEINPLIDSVLYYDQLPVTKQRIGEILITRNLDIKRGRDLIAAAFSKLTVPYHIYNSYMLMAKSDITLRKFASAKINYEKALQTDSTRAEAWYEYLGYLNMMELPNEAGSVRKKIIELEKEDKLLYLDYTNISPNINKNISGLSLINLDKRTFDLNSLEGKVVVINCFNFWCGYCVKEFPTLKKMIKEFPEVEFVFLNLVETAPELRDRYFKMNEFKFLAKQKVLFSTIQFNREIYGNGVPQTLVIDKEGTVRYDYYGYRKELESALRGNLQKLIKE